mmetsp:Transcript_17222/g.47508  ORF Transcript_17222/g.47508 Transcript_17222/m.47508 type:complete len:200 (+) Transcript_17222:559-1158(+)
MPCDAVSQPDQKVVELDVALFTFVEEQRVGYVLLHHIHSIWLGKAKALVRPRTADHARAPVPVGLLDEPRHGRRPRRLRGRCLPHPPLVRDDVSQGHQVWHEVVKLPFVLQPDPALDVHGNAAEVRLVGEINTPPAQGAVADLPILVLKPLLARIDPPVRPLQQVGAEALAVAAHVAIGAVEPLPLLDWLGRQHGRNAL